MILSSLWQVAWRLVVAGSDLGVLGLYVVCGGIPVMYGVSGELQV